MSPKLNIIVNLKFELANSDVEVKHFTYYPFLPILPHFLVKIGRSSLFKICVRLFLSSLFDFALSHQSSFPPRILKASGNLIQVMTGCALHILFIYE